MRDADNGLFFDGRCKEAIEFYRTAIGADVEMLLFHSDSPDPHPPGMLEPGFEDKVMHTTVRIGGATLMASDGCDAKSTFSKFRLSLALPTEAEAQRAFDALSAGAACDRFPCFASCQRDASPFDPLVAAESGD